MDKQNTYDSLNQNYNDYWASAAENLANGQYEAAAWDAAMADWTGLQIIQAQVALEITAAIFVINDCFEGDPEPPADQA